MKSWLTSSWSDIKGESTRKGHPAPFPIPLAERLIRLFSFAGDTVLDPFCGTSTTSVAAINTGRNSIACDIEPKYISLATERLSKETKHERTHGATTCIVTTDIGTCAEQGKASTVLTFNAGDCTAVGKDFAVVIPGSI